MDIHNIKEQFPILNQKVYGKKLVYLDNGATTQKPQVVIDQLVDYYTRVNSNVHRGVHYLSQLATDQLENARLKVANFINADVNEIVYTRGTTESINLLASSLGDLLIHEGDEILITEMEHHSNIVPWSLLAQRKNATVKYIPLTEKGTLDIENIDQYFTEKTKIMAVTMVSNTLGTVNPVEYLIEKAHSKNVIVVLDAAQAIQHLPIDVKALDVDFLVASGHKMYAATGIGFLYGKYKWLQMMPPYQGGGSMIETVSMEKITFNDPPFRFEAGTPDICGAINLGTAIEFIQSVGLENISQYEEELIQYLETQLNVIPGVRVLASGQHKAGAISLIFEKAHPFDVGELLDKMGIAVRTGHHCCAPIMSFFKIPGTLRVSIAMYNTKEDIDIFVDSLKKALAIL